MEVAPVSEIYWIFGNIIYENEHFIGTATGEYIPENALLNDSQLKKQPNWEWLVVTWKASRIIHDAQMSKWTTEQMDKRTA